MASSGYPSSLERAILEVGKRGWLLKGLGRSAFNCANPWSCDAHPGHFKEYVWGRPVKTGLYTHYENGMVRIVVDGATPLEAVKKAIAEIDASKRGKVYRRLERALERWADAQRQASGNS